MALQSLTQPFNDLQAHLAECTAALNSRGVQTSADGSLRAALGHMQTSLAQQVTVLGILIANQQLIGDRLQACIDWIQNADVKLKLGSVPVDL